MELRRSRLSARRVTLAAGAVLAALAVVAGSLVPDVSAAAPAAPVTGTATHFDGLGAPYGGCGIPQEVLDSQDFVALNVYNTPGDYSFYPRPIPPSQAAKIGLWDNGRNCGRFVQVAISDYCTGTNDGAPGQPFCRNGSWIADGYSGATLTMVVADSCGDSNAWCRDDPNHLDLSTPSINRFVRNGVPVGDLNPGHWNNRKVSWSYVPAPNYTGDLRLGFLQGAQRYWPAIAVSHLANGIHGVEYLGENGAWTQAKPNSDMGQSFIIGPTTTAGTAYEIRVRDAADAPVNGGRTYKFSLPDQCSSRCSAAYTGVTYTTGDGTPPTTTTTTPPPVGGCTTTATVTGSWSGGYQLAIVVKNTGSSPLSGWTSSFSFEGDQKVSNSWNAVVSQNGRQVTANNEGHNGILAAGASTSWGAIVNGANLPLSATSCAGR